MAKLILDRAGTREAFPLTEDGLTIGRSPGNTIVIDDPLSSRRHCRIDRVGDGFELLDLESQNGTRVNGKAVKRHHLAAGDRIEIGSHVFTMEEDEVEIEEIAVGSADEGRGGQCGVFLVFEGGPRDAEEIRLAEGVHGVGRRLGPGVDIQFDDASVSGKHAEIRVSDTGATVRDLGSTNGTFKNGARVSDCEVRHGDQLRFGSVKLRFSDPGAATGLPEVSVLKGDAEARAKRSNVPALILGILVIGAGVAGYTTLRSRGGPVRVAGPAPAASLIQEGWSIEEPESGELWRTESGTASPQDGAAQSGAFALRLTASGGEAAHGAASAVYDRDLAVRAGASYELAGAIASAGGSGVAGFEVRFYDRAGAHPDSPVRRSGTDLVAGAKTFTRARAIVQVPASLGVSHARVACVAVGDSFRALFDDVVFQPADPPGSGGEPAVSLDPFTLDATERGVLALRKGTASYLEEMQLAGLKSGLGVLDSALLLREPAFKFADRGRGLECSATLSAPGAEASKPFTLEAQVEEPIVKIRLTGPDPSAVGLDSLFFEAFLGEKLATQPILLVTSRSATPVTDDTESSEATGVVFGAGAERIRIQSPTPVTISVAVSTRTPRVRFVPLAAERFSLELHLQLSFTSERAQAQSLRLEAEQAERASRFGDAIEKFRTILRDYPFNEKVTADAEARLSALESRSAREAARLEAALAEAQFFGMAPFLEKVKGSAAEVSRLYAGTRVAEEASKIAQQAEVALQAIGQRAAETEAAKRLEKGRDFKKTGKETLALLVFQNVAERFPATKAAGEAREELAGMKPEGPR